MVRPEGVAYSVKLIALGLTFIHGEKQRLMAGAADTSCALDQLGQRLYGETYQLESSRCDLAGFGHTDAIVSSQ